MENPKYRLYIGFGLKPYWNVFHGETEWTISLTVSTVDQLKCLLEYKNYISYFIKFLNF